LTSIGACANAGAAHTRKRQARRFMMTLTLAGSRFVECLLGQTGCPPRNT
jgi:hypothetical protein